MRNSFPIMELILHWYSLCYWNLVSVITVDQVSDLRFEYDLPCTTVLWFFLESRDREMIGKVSLEFICYLDTLC